MASKVTSTACCLGKAAIRTTPQRTLLPVQSSTYTTCRTIQCSVSAQRPNIFQQKQHLPTLTKALLARNASTSTSTSTTQNTSAAAQTTLTWDEFLKLRRTRRYVNLVASIFSGAGSIAVATPLIAEYEIESIGAQITGLDPMFVIGGSLMAVGGVGWLMGPFLGTAFFKIWKSSVATEFARKEKAFYGHIKRYRADPTSSSVNNPVPDYYGEKIGSVADYRRWLKDQRAFNRKKNKNMI